MKGYVVNAVLVGLYMEKKHVIPVILDSKRKKGSMYNSVD
jgi:hypothetical protein